MVKKREKRMKSLMIVQIRRDLFLETGILLIGYMEFSSIIIIIIAIPFFSFYGSFFSAAMWIMLYFYAACCSMAQLNNSFNLSFSFFHFNPIQYSDGLALADRRIVRSNQKVIGFPSQKIFILVLNLDGIMLRYTQKHNFHTFCYIFPCFFI